MGAYLLVTAGRRDPGERVEATQVFEKLMLLLLSEGFWPHGACGSDGVALEPADVVLFCLVDGETVQIVGDAAVAAGSSPLGPQRLGQVRMYLGPALPPDPAAFTHSVVLTQMSLLDEPCRCGLESEWAGSEVRAALQGRAATGEVLPVARETFESLVGRAAPEEAFYERAPRPPRTAAPAPASHDHELRDAVFANFGLVDFGERLRPPVRRDVPTPAGRIDLVCESADGGEIIAVMWANGEPPQEVLAAAHERLAWLRHDLGEERREVRGLVLTLDGSGDMAAGDNGELQVRQVRIRCEPLESPGLSWLDPLEEDRSLAAPAIIARPLTDHGRPSVLQGVSAAVDLDFAAKCLRVPRSHR